MSFSRRSLFVKRCSSSVPSGNEAEMAKDYCEIRSKDGFFEAPESSGEIPHEEKLKNVRNTESITNSRQGHERGQLISGNPNDDEADNAIQRLLSETQSNDESYFTNTADGRRSRQGFTPNNSRSNEKTQAVDVRSNNVVDKISSFMAFSYDSTLRPKRGISRKKYSGNKQTLKRNNLRDDISRAVGQPQRSLSASYSSIPRPKKNNFLRNSDSGDCFSKTENSNFILGTNVPSKQSRTAMSNLGSSSKPRPKKRNSTRKPNFTDHIMLSTDIDQILEEELMEFDASAKMSSRSREDSIPREDLNQKPLHAEDSKLEQNVEYILGDDEPNGSTLHPRKMSSTKRRDYEDNIKGTDSRDTIVEEEVIECDHRATVRASKSCRVPLSQRRLFQQARQYSDILACSAKGDNKKRPINHQSRAQDFMSLDAVVNEILEIPVSESSKDKIDSVPTSVVAKHKYRSSVVVTASKSVNAKNYKNPEDYSIEELVAELFPDLLAYVVPRDAPDDKLADDSIQKMNRDSVCSVTDGDTLRPMAAGLSDMTSVRPYSRSSRACPEKWTTGIVYTEEELMLMAQIERGYTVGER